ncbi:NYN domain-containing protein [Dactylosporangium sp. CA-233914]|uniref:NYN domain-containing protein n=1 Tax=Dactylosporangium sp. CA-233914 TaxID=3239934 RepID=UPI003D94437D
MHHVRAAFFLDFDNVYSGLFKLDPEVAVLFATEPGVWLQRLTTALSDAPRRFLIQRCYLNPSGWVNQRDGAGETSRQYFSRFRPSFVRAGFEVIDCPRYNATKNAADIRIVVDALDALADDTRYEEFVIASGDSDMTPLLQRLRRADRRTMVVSPADAAEAFTAIADQLLDSQRLLALVQGEPVDLDLDDDAGQVGTEFPADAAYAQFRSIVTAEYEAAASPLNMASLAYRLRDELGPVVGTSNWFGFGSFARALESLELPGLHMSQHLLWDERRHQAPDPATPGAPRAALPDPVERLADQLSLPRLPQPWWPSIYETLSRYAGANRFNLTQCTSWSRDRLREAGVPVSRGAVAFVVRGTSFGGSPLHRQPPPTPAEIGTAFVNNVLSRAEAAQIPLTDEDEATVRAWLGAPDAAAG